MKSLALLNTSSYTVIQKHNARVTKINQTKMALQGLISTQHLTNQKRFVRLQNTFSSLTYMMDLCSHGPMLTHIHRIQYVSISTPRILN
jgi:uncharacterized protein with von Willebrand factor type A (vWA) domain